MWRVCGARVSINRDSDECNSGSNLVYPEGTTDRPPNPRCSSNNPCPTSARPIGVRSSHYFNVGLAVGQYGVIVRTMDGGYTWDCIRGCVRSPDRATELPDLHSISVNVRLGGFGYERAYYNSYGYSTVDGIDWTLLTLETGQPQYTGKRHEAETVVCTRWTQLVRRLTCSPPLVSCVWLRLGRRVLGGPWCVLGGLRRGQGGHNRAPCECGRHRMGPSRCGQLTGTHAPILPLAPAVATLIRRTYI